MSSNGLKFIPRKLNELNELFTSAKPFCRSFQKSSKLESVKVDFEIPNSMEIPKNVSIMVRPSTSIHKNPKFERVVRPRTVQPNFPKMNMSTNKACRSLVEPSVSKTVLFKKGRHEATLKTSRKSGATTSRSVISANSGKRFKIIDVRTKAPSGYMSNFKTTTNTIRIPIVDFTKRNSLILEKGPMSSFKKEISMIDRLKALELLKTPRNLFRPTGKVNRRSDGPEYFFNLLKIRTNFNTGSTQKNDWKYVK